MPTSQSEEKTTVERFIDRVFAQWWFRYPFVGVLLYGSYRVYLSNQQASTFWALVLAGTAVYILRKDFTVQAERLRPVTEMLTNVDLRKHSAMGKVDRVIYGLFTRWWCRYPFAGLLLYGSYKVYLDGESGSTFWALALAAAALYIAREVFAVVAGLAVLYLIAWAIFGAVASLPVSVAIIIGAMIIAGAVSSK